MTPVFGMLVILFDGDAGYCLRSGVWRYIRHTSNKGLEFDISRLQSNRIELVNRRVPLAINGCMPLLIRGFRRLYKTYSILSRLRSSTPKEREKHVAQP